MGPSHRFLFSFVNLTLFFHRQFRWLNLPGACLLALLQRTPAVQMATTAAEFVGSSPTGSVLRSAVVGAVSLGAIHSMAGATQFSISRTSVTGTVGAAIAGIGFTVTGAPSTPPGSFRISNLPPGLTVGGMNANGVLNAGSGVITGTPTAAGNFTTTILAFEFSGAQGDAFGPATITFSFSAAAATAPLITTQPQSQTASVGTSAIFTAAASGSPAPAFVWTRNNVTIAGATNATLTLPNVQLGDAGNYVVTATNSAGAAVSNTATLTVAAPPALPVFTLQPSSQTMALGSTVVFTAAASATTAFQWKLNGNAIPGATNAMLVLTNLTAASAGAYTCVASNATGATNSIAAALAVGNFSAAATGHLINVSILTTAGSGAKALTVGMVIGPLGFTNALPLVVRAVGPTLGIAPFNIPGVLADPVLTVNASGNATPIATNDDWGGGTTMTTAFASVGAFALPAGSRDSAFVSVNGLTPGGYTVQVTGKANASGLVIAEIYDAGDATRTATTPRLINLSTLTSIDAGATLAAGFVLRGSTSRTLLIRGVGPSLGALGVGGTMNDPKLEFFNNDTGVKIGENDNWGGDAQLTAAMAAVGAFALSGATTKDAVLLVTLPPGAYSARVSDTNGGAGTAIVEIYEVP